MRGRAEERPCEAGPRRRPYEAEPRRGHARPGRGGAMRGRAEEGPCEAGPRRRPYEARTCRGLGFVSGLAPMAYTSHAHV